MRSPPALRYRHKMTKSLSKLVLRKQTIRALGHIDLARVIGGADPAIAAGESIAKTCAARAIAQPPDR